MSAQRAPNGARFAERTAALAFLLSGAAGIGLAVVYWRGGQPQLEGTLLATAFGSLAYGLVTWANRLMPPGPAVEERHVLPEPEEERRQFEQDLERGGAITSRRLLLRTLAVAAGGLGVAAVFPIRSLGPKPGRALLQTPWRNGLKLVTEYHPGMSHGDVMGTTVVRGLRNLYGQPDNPGVWPE